MIKLLLVAFLCIALTGCASVTNYKKESTEKTKVIQGLTAKMDEISKENERLSAERSHLENQLAKDIVSEFEEDEVK